MVNGKKVLGVIGGMGPIATSYFMELVIKMTEADTDQDHLDMIIYNIPSIPDRTSYILDHSKDSPLPVILDIAHKLELQGVEFLAMPCCTAHYFQEELENSLHKPFVNIIRATVGYLKERGIKRVGVMATDGTMRQGLFKKELEANGMEMISPSPERQKDVMHIIYENVKANRPAEMKRFNKVGDELKAKGAQAIILGCTELSLVKRDYNIGAGFIDAMEVLAQKSLVSCGSTLKAEYEELITE
ncbi:MAG: aspartate/glutamate racemase family protein [Parasporobacterium sp.]|nr:aspartate/glutamate racemase family protein [Parasporobacterium sp.]